MKGKKGLINRALAALCFTMALVLLLSGLGATLARYVQQDKNRGVANAAPFYFVSDKLKEGSPDRYPFDESEEEGVVTLSFTLSNFKENPGDTDLGYTKAKISYEYWLTNASGDTLEGQGGFGILEGENQTETITLTMEEGYLGAGDMVTVFVRSTAPYEKTLSAEFGGITRQNELQWNVEEQEGAVVLEVYGGSGSPVTVTSPASLLPDPYNELLQGVSGNSVTFTPQPGNRYALTFLKEGAGTYSKEDFTVTEE